jgi:hypothetical protein
VIPWLELGGVRVGAVLWGGLALVDVGRLAGAPSYAELGALAVLVVAASAGMRTLTGLGAALTGWLLVDGFVEHGYGDLGFDVTRDLAVLVLLTALSLLATKAHR